jgi:hypothetical protein
MPQQKKKMLQKMLFTYLNKRDNLKGECNQSVVTLVEDFFDFRRARQSALHHSFECQVYVSETLSTIATELNTICHNM